MHVFGPLNPDEISGDGRTMLLIVITEMNECVKFRTSDRRVMLDCWCKSRLLLEETYWTLLIARCMLFHRP